MRQCSKATYRCRGYLDMYLAFRRTRVFSCFVLPAVICGLALFSFNSSPVASPLRGIYQETGSPFLLYDAPSMLTAQPGVPIGCEVDYFSQTNHAEGRIAFVKSIEQSGFSVGYLFDGSSVPTQRVSGAAAHQVGRFNFGGVLNLSIRESAAFSLDIGAGFLAFADWRFSLLGRNIIPPDTTFSDRRRELRVEMGGPVIPDRRIELNGDIGVYVEDYDKHELGYGATLSIRKHFFTNPSVSVLLGGHGDFPPQGQRSAVASLGVGWRMTIQSAAVSFCGEYGYDYYGRDDGLSFVLRFDPVAALDREPPEVDVELSDTLLTRGHGAGPRHVVISLGCTEETGGSGIRKWLVVIADRPYTTAQIVRSYTGGGIPPSSISWDGRDSGGTLCERGAYYLRFIAVDTRGNVGKTEWKKIIIE